MEIKRGQRIYWKPEFKDEGDDSYIFMAYEDYTPAPQRHFVRVAIFNPRADELDLLRVTYQTVGVDCIERVENYVEGIR